jgi:hypothetical protein
VLSSGLLILFVFMKQSILPILAIAIAFSACKSDESGYLPTSAKLPEATSAQSVDTSKGLNLNKPSQISTSVVPVSTTSTPAPATVTTVTPAAAPATAKGMNPPHGQPGHRCDIEVGAPLNSAPKSTAVQQPGSVKPVTPTVTTTTPSTPAGMNPPHGQPGHRCDISVGAPLNSKPTVQPTEQKAPTTQPAVKDSTSGGK